MNIQFDRCVIVVVGSILYNNITHNFAKIIDTYTYTHAQTILSEKLNRIWILEEVVWMEDALKSALIAAHCVCVFIALTHTPTFQISLAVVFFMRSQNQHFRIVENMCSFFLLVLSFYSVLSVFFTEKKKWLVFDTKTHTTHSPNIPFNRFRFSLTLIHTLSQCYIFLILILFIGVCVCVWYQYTI